MRRLDILLFQQRSKHGIKPLGEEKNIMNTRTTVMQDRTPCIGHHRPWRSSIWLAAAATLLLSACGGGGGGGGGNSGGPQYTMSVSPQSLSVSGSLGQPAPTATFSVNVAGSQAGQQFYLDGKYSTSGISTVSDASGSLPVTITVQFKDPTTLGIGTYNDSVQISVCQDQACTMPLSNSPQTVAVTYVVSVAAPQVYSITPSSVTAGAAAFTLTVSGANFQSNSQVLWNGSARSTTYVSSNQLTAQINAADVATSGTANVQVATGSAMSPTVAFAITPLAALSLSQVSPRQVAAGGGTFYVSAIGTGFASSSTITWNGTNLATTYVSATLLRALVTPALIASTGSASITVVNPQSLGGTSGAQNISIVAATLDATSYQINPAHTGSVSFQNLALPSGSTWSVDVGGSPSYALIVGGSVFVTANVNGSSQLVALNAASGATLWGPIALTGQVNVAYDGGRLFAVSGSSTTQIISALDPSTGNPLWSATVPGDWFPEPPVAAAGIVYTINGGEVTAFDEGTGATLWSAGIGGTSGIVSVTPDGVYGAAPCTAIDLQPAVGTVLWSYNSGCEGGGGSTPVVANGVLYAPDSSAGSSGTVFDAESGALSGTYSASVIPAFTANTGFFLSGGTLQGLARSNSQVLWSFAGDGQLSSAPIVVNNYVFVGSAGGNLYGLDATSGAQVWTQNLGAAVPSSTDYGLVIYTGLSAGDGLLVVPSGTKVTAYTLSTSP
jgi:outer membrane protein assembly factor BamB